MNNFEKFETMLDIYLKTNDVSLRFVSNLHDTSLNNSDKENPQYLYNGAELKVVDMDLIAKKGYKLIKGADGKDNIINTADAFLINSGNEWFLIEFKDSKIKADNKDLKNSILKKAYSNWYMLLDILYLMRYEENVYVGFNFDQPVDFAKQHVQYVLVCSTEKNPNVYQQIKNHELIGERYTPPFMQRLKDYLFKDAYIYTESFLKIIL